MNKLQSKRNINRLQQLELLVEAKRVSARIAAGREKAISHEALKRQILARRTREDAPHVDDIGLHVCFVNLGKLSRPMKMDHRLHRSSHRWRNHIRESATSSPIRLTCGLFHWCNSTA